MRSVPVIRLLLVAAMLVLAAAVKAEEVARLSVLMLGDDGHHRPAAMHRLAAPELAKAGIDLSYTADVADLTHEKLARYDGLIIYRDSGDLPADSEAALLAYVEQGKGLVTVHCASHCFRNSAKYTALVGGRFARHDTGVFRARIIDAQHPAMRGVASFESWDETYVHNELAEDIRVLMVREHEGGYEPYTWVRDQGQGRVFYCALGHDERTWKATGFQKLLIAGLRWAAGRTRDDLPPPELTDADEGLPNYLAGKKWGTEGDRLRRMPKPLSPAESMRHAHMPEGFRIELVAAEPDVVKPIAMAFDERGRLWVAESLDYPNTLCDDPHENGADRIKICEDTDGDGRADRFTVFADRLNIPTSVLPVRGGAVVAVAPHILLLLDTDGDDRADERRILFTGFGRRDTHAVVSNLHYGLDNWIYATVGYSGGRVQAGGAEHSFRQGLLRFRPDGSDFEVLTSTSNNTWGLGLSEAGDIFASTANNEHSVHLAIPNRYFESVRGWHAAGSAAIEDHKRYHPIAADVRQMDWHGGFTAAAGHELYTARAFPRDYWNRAALVCEPTGHLVHIDWLVPRGSGFVARDGYNLLASTDPWSAPIAAQVGPDGAVWMLDWYNYVVQHNPTPHGFQTGPGNAYETALRDRAHGRVYRIVSAATTGMPSPRLARDMPAELVAALAHDNLLWRLHSQRLLVERGERDVLPDLMRLADSAESPAAVIHALYAVDGLRRAVGLGDLESRFAAACVAGLSHRDPAVRRTALRLLPRTANSATAILAAGSLEDNDPQVRLDALLALAEMPVDAPCAIAIAKRLTQADNASDRWIPLAATSAAARNSLAFLRAAVASPAAEKAPDAVVAAARAVAEHFARSRTADNGTESLAGLLADVAHSEPAVADAILAGLATGWPAGQLPTTSDELKQSLLALVPRLPATGARRIVTLARRWGIGDSLQGVADQMQAALLTEASDAARPDADRLAAIEGLLSLKVDAQSVRAVLDQITPRAVPEFAAGVLEAIGKTKGADVGEAIVARFAQFTPATQRAAASVLLERAEWTGALLDALERDQIAAASLTVEIEGRLTHHPDVPLRERAKRFLARGGRLANPDRQRILAELLPLADRRGDAAAGKLVFEKNCAKCHRHGATGGNVGPDLTGMAARRRADVLTDVLDPNRSVEGNFQQYTVETTDGRVLVGLLAAETKTTVELVDAEARMHALLREDIDQLASSKLSIMPEGFEKLPADEVVNLLEFLAARGRFLPLPLDKVATATSTVGMFHSHDAEAERLIFPDWSPQTFFGVPFHLVDPRGDRTRNVVLLHSPNGRFPPEMPKSVSLPCHAPAKTIHLLSGVSGWGYPLGDKGSLTLTVRLVYVDGQTEDHPLRNGEHFADYNRRVDVPGSQFARSLREQQIRYLAIHPRRREEIERIDLVKGDDATAPVVMACTVEAAQ
ncbi:MAG: ThuA domain-containing protein [Planctomycetia bacterium]|nr:ThuA domain-containing protein [Planctomycetia bacterium]